MKGIKLIRIDFRLIHGQVITKWSNKVAANKIIVVNDELSQDDFMADIYVMAAPPGIEVEVLSEDDFIKSANIGKYESGNILVLFKNIRDTLNVVKKGIVFSAIQIGGLGGGTNKKSITKGIYVSGDDIKDLQELQNANIEVSFQVTPEEARLSLEKALKKLGV